jgi:hypothetical protein
MTFPAYCIFFNFGKLTKLPFSSNRCMNLFRKDQNLDVPNHFSTFFYSGVLKSTRAKILPIRQMSFHEIVSGISGLGKTYQTIPPYITITAKESYKSIVFSLYALKKNKTKDNINHLLLCGNSSANNPRDQS